MSDDGDDTSDELGKSGEKMGGIADRFGATTDTDETTETAETTSMSETAETSETTETVETIEDDTEPNGSSETTEPAKTAETTETTETADTLQPDDKGFVLREDWNGRTIYLPDDVVDNLDIRYSEVNVKWQREHGEQLPKNERFYPALVRAAINETSIEEELGIGD